MSKWKKMLESVGRFVGGDGVREGDPVFLLGPRRSGKTIFLASLFNTDDLRVRPASEATLRWKEQTMRVFFERQVVQRTDVLDYGSINEFKEQARRNWHQLASSALDPHLFKRMMLDIALSFPAREAEMHRVCLPDPSGEIFVQDNLLESEGYSRYLEALVSAMGYVVIVSGGSELHEQPGGQATALLHVLHKLLEHAGNASYITRPVSVVMMKMDQHIQCCLDCRETTAEARTACLRTQGLDSERMAELFGRWFHRVNLRTIRDIVDRDKLRFFGMSAYGFGPDGQPACTAASNGEDFVPTRDSQPINIVEPVKWALGLGSE